MTSCLRLSVSEPSNAASGLLSMDVFLLALNMEYIRSWFYGKILKVLLNINA